jgi:uncharacterized protein (DUF2267 family)
MDQLVNLVSEKTGLPKDKSRQAVEVVIGFLKDRLPGPIAAQLDAVLAGKDVSENLDDMAQGLGGLLGKK